MVKILPSGYSARLSVLNPSQDASEPQRGAREPVLRARREARSPASSKPGQGSASPPAREAPANRGAGESVFHDEVEGGVVDLVEAESGGAEFGPDDLGVRVAE